MKNIVLVIMLLVVYCSSNAQNINKLEYFIDTDKGVGKNKLVNITAATDVTASFTVNLDDVSAGYHTLYVRTKNTNGNWSHAARQTIEVLPLNAQKVIAKGEYFFDTDKGYGNGKKISIQNGDSAIVKNFTGAVAGLTPGYHNMYVRFLDNYGAWTQTAKYTVQVLKNSDTSYIVEVEYFFSKDNGVGKCASITLTPAESGTFTFNIPNDELPANLKKLYVRVKDSAAGSWSLTRVKTFKKNNLEADDAIAENLTTAKPSVVMAPNPATSYFNLQLNGFEKQTNMFVTVKDIAGKTVLTQKISAPLNKQFDVSHLAKGIYIVTIFADGFNSSQKLVIQ